MKRKPEVPGKQLTVRVPPEVHRAVKVRAAEERRSAAVLVEDTIRGYLVGPGAKKGKP